MAGAVPTYDPRVGLQPPSPQSPSGQFQMASTLGRLGQVVEPLVREQEQQGLAQAAREGGVAGGQYGLATPPADLHLPTGDSVGEEAFRRSAIQSAGVQVGLDARESVLGLADRFQQDPEGFKTAVKASAAGFVKGLPPELQEAATQHYDFYAGRQYARLDEEWRASVKDQQSAVLQRGFDTDLADMGNLARAGDLAGAEALARKSVGMAQAAGPVVPVGPDGKPDPAGIHGSGAMTAGQIEQHREKVESELGLNAVHGLIDRTSPAGKPALLTALEGGRTGDATVDRLMSGLKPEVRDHLIAVTRQEIRQDRVEANQAAAVRDQGVAINRSLFLEGRAADQLRERVDGNPIDEPITRSEFMAHYPGTAAAAGAKAWASYSRQAAAADVQGEFKTAPADVLDAEIAKSAPVHGEPGYDEKSRYYDALVAGRSAVLAKRETAPVEATMQSSPAVAQAWSAAAADPSKLPQAVQASVAEQQRLGIRNVQPLPQGAVAATVGAWKAGETASDRLAAIAPLTIGLAQQRPDGTFDDSLAAKGLKQLEKAGLDPGTNYALEAARAGDTPRAHEIVGWLAVDPKHLPDPGDARADQVKQAVAQVYQGTNAARAEAEAYNLTGQPGAAEAAARGQALLLRGAMVYAARGEPPADAAAHALRVLHGDKPVTTDPELGIVPLPPGVTDAKGFENALALTRENVDLAHLAPTREGVTARLTAYLGHPPAPGEVEGVLAQATADHDALAGDLRNGAGRWLAAPGGFQLITPNGQAVPGPDGKPRIWTADQIMHHAMTGGTAKPDLVGNPFAGGQGP